MEIKCQKYLQVLHFSFSPHSGKLKYFLLNVLKLVNICSRCPLAQAIMLFSISGSRTESMGDKINAYNMYNQTLHLIKYVMKLTTSKNAKKDTDLR